MCASQGTKRRNAYKKQSVSQVFQKLPPSNGKITATQENASWQCDLIDWTKQVKAKNMGARFVLVCVDIFSRKMYAEPQPNKTPQTTLAAFRRILASGEEPKGVDTDLGAEFGRLFCRLPRPTRDWT